jgi:hypothetical protein
MCGDREREEPSVALWSIDESLVGSIQVKSNKANIERLNACWLMCSMCLCAACGMLYVLL